jgi:hypothetical protein
VFELRGRDKLLRHLSRRVRSHHMRVIELSDSLVVLGSGAKGRSPAIHTLNRELRLGLPDLLGGDLEIAEFYCGTDIIPADDPSRGRAVAGSCDLSPEAALRLAGGIPIITAADEKAWRRGQWHRGPTRSPRDARYGLRAQRINEVSADFEQSCPRTPAVVIIGKSRRKRKGSRREHVLIEDPLLAAALQLRLSGYAGRWLHAHRPSTFDSRLRGAQLMLGHHEPLTASSFRPGGALAEYLRTKRHDCLMSRDRWSAAATLLG